MSLFSHHWFWRNLQTNHFLQGLFLKLGEWVADKMTLVTSKTCFLLFWWRVKLARAPICDRTSQAVFTMKTVQIIKIMYGRYNVNSLIYLPDLWWSFSWSRSCPLKQVMLQLWVTGWILFTQADHKYVWSRQYETFMASAHLLRTSPVH